MKYNKASKKKKMLREGDEIRKKKSYNTVFQRAEKEGTLPKEWIEKDYITV